MYLIGVEFKGETDIASMVLIKRIRKELRKHYHVLDVQRSLINSTNPIIGKISKIYNDPNYTIRKPRFSQIGRPKKIVNERPLIFVACSDVSLKYIHYLKQKKIPATCISVTNEKNWRMEANGNCLKGDFFIPKKILISILLAVIEQERLVLNKDEYELSEALNAYRNVGSCTITKGDKSTLDDLVLALAMPVWYYENLLAIRPRTP
jgi:hypothetical protein